MEIMLDVLFACMIAALLTVAAAAKFKRLRRTDTLSLVFVLVLAVVWSGELWLVPDGQAANYMSRGYSVAAGLLAAIVFIAALPRIRSSRETADQLKRQPAVFLFTMIVWVAIVLLAASIIVRYMR